MKTPLSKASLMVLTLAACLSLQSTQAQVSTRWKSDAIDHDWQTAGNWSEGVPGVADTAYIQNGGSAEIHVAVTDIDYLRVGGTPLSQLTIFSSGSLKVTGSGRTRIGDAAGTLYGLVNVNGGALTGSGRLYIGNSADDSQGTLTIQNGGTVSGYSYVGLSVNTQSGQTATLNIGGASTAAAPGWLDAVHVSGFASANPLAANVNSVVFNHTGNRYHFTTGPSSTTAVEIRGSTTVSAKAGVTVLSGANTYTEGTTVAAGAVLLANYMTASSTASSLGTGSVTVASGGTLGGRGHIAGATSIDGILQPGDDAFGNAEPAHGVLKFANDLTLGATSTTLIALNGSERETGYDALDITGHLTLDGQLKINLMENFSIALNKTESFQIFNVTGNINGAFDTFELPTNWNGLDLQWDTSVLSTTGMISVTAIPEPSTMALVGMAVAIFGLAAGRRLRSQNSFPSLY
ncbi:MAG TPA: PEP-CTERM sorting domain-containing protein [Chthoniobacteraceae bacterium]|nr:PEP-CTERM sorting domain-containing protein [Chthoniobacteraceae bacterium]